jgi:hypothetical protein
VCAARQLDWSEVIARPALGKKLLFSCVFPKAQLLLENEMAKSPCDQTLSEKNLWMPFLGVDT